MEREVWFLDVPFDVAFVSKSSCFLPAFLPLFQLANYVKNLSLPINVL